MEPVVDPPVPEQAQNSVEISCLRVKLNYVFENSVDERKLVEIRI